MPKRERIRVLKERIRAGGAAAYYDDPRYDDDAATLLTVSDQFDLHDYSDNRHEKLLRHLVRVAEKVGGLTDALDDREAAEALVRWINLEYDNPRTKCDYRLAIRAMGKHALRRGTHGEPPESIAWMSSNTPRTDYKLEGFELGAFFDSCTVHQVGQDVGLAGHCLFTRHLWCAPHPSGAHKHGSTLARRDC